MQAAGCQPTTHSQGPASGSTSAGGARQSCTAAQTARGSPGQRSASCPASCRSARCRRCARRCRSRCSPLATQHGCRGPRSALCQTAWTPRPRCRRGRATWALAPQAGLPCRRSGPPTGLGLAPAPARAGTWSARCERPCQPLARVSARHRCHGQTSRRCSSRQGRRCCHALPARAPAWLARGPLVQPLSAAEGAAAPALPPLGFLGGGNCAPCPRARPPLPPPAWRRCWHSRAPAPPLKPRGAQTAAAAQATPRAALRGLLLQNHAQPAAAGCCSCFCFACLMPAGWLQAVAQARRPPLHGADVRGRLLAAACCRQHHCSKSACCFHRRGHARKQAEASFGRRWWRSARSAQLAGQLPEQRLPAAPVAAHCHQSCRLTQGQHQQVCVWLHGPLPTASRRQLLARGQLLKVLEAAAAEDRMASPALLARPPPAPRHGGSMPCPAALPLLLRLPLEQRKRCHRLPGWGARAGGGPPPPGTGSLCPAPQTHAWLSRRNKPRAQAGRGTPAKHRGRGAAARTLSHAGCAARMACKCSKMSLLCGAGALL